MTRGRCGWLGLQRKVLSSSTPCRFIPALSPPGEPGSVQDGWGALFRRLWPFSLLASSLFVGLDGVYVLLESRIFPPALLLLPGLSIVAMSLLLTVLACVLADALFLERRLTAATALWTGLVSWALLLPLEAVTGLWHRLSVVTPLALLPLAAGLAWVLSLPPGQLWRSSLPQRFPRRRGLSRALDGLGRASVVGLSLAGVSVLSALIPSYFQRFSILTALVLGVGLVLAVGAALLAADRLSAYLENRLPPTPRALALGLLALTWTANAALLVMRRPPDTQVRATAEEAARAGVVPTRTQPIGNVPKKPDAKTGVSTRGPATPRRSDSKPLTGSTHLDGPSQALSPPPHLLLVILSGVRRDAFSPYANPRSEGLDLADMARGAWVFEHALSPSSWGLPGVGTLLTGHSPSSHRADRPQPQDRFVMQEGLGPISPLRAELATLAGRLTVRGYVTEAMLADFHSFDPQLGLARGFQRYSAQPRVLLRSLPVGLRLLGWLMPGMAGKLGQERESDEVILARASAWLSKQPIEKPTFLTIELADALATVPGPQSQGTLAEEGALVAQAMREGQPIPPTLVQRVQARYREAVLAQEARLALFLDDLRRGGRLEKTLVVLVSSHGVMLGEHGMMGQGLELWRPQVEVPLLVKMPGPDRAQRVTTPVGLEDVAPTLLAASGAEYADLPGKSLVQVAQADASGVRPTPRGFINQVQPSSQELARLGPSWNRSLSCLTQFPMRYCESSGGAPRLYDLLLDPEEKENLAPSRPEEVKRLAGTLAKMRDGVGGLGQGGQKTGQPREKPRPAVSDTEELRALGYIR